MKPFALRSIGLLLLTVGAFSGKLSAAPLLWTLPRLDATAQKIEYSAAVAYDAAQHKLYVGTRSRDKERRGVLIFDTDATGAPQGDARRYSDHPDALPSGQWSNVNAILLDTKHHKLWMGVGSNSNAAVAKSLVMYDLDAKGEPVGEPQAFDNGNPQHATNALALHPRLNRLYIVGWGGAAFYTMDLDANGRPAGVPQAHAVGGAGKYSIALRADGSKLYLGTYPSVLEVADLDEKGNLNGKARSYPIANGEKVYLQMAAARRGIYFRGADGNLGYFALDAAGEPTGAPHSVADRPVQMIAAGAPGRLVVAASRGFTDALTGKHVVDGVQVQEIALQADGAPGALVRQSALIERSQALALAAEPAAALVTKSLGRGFLGNRFKGLKLRVTLMDAQSGETLPPGTQTSKLGTLGKYLKFAYSPSRGYVYAAGDGVLYSVSIQDGKSTPVPLPAVSGAVALDESAGVLYVAQKDGKVAARQLDANGLPEKAGNSWQTGLKLIAALIVNPQTHQVYALGAAGAAQPTAKTPVITVSASQYVSDVAIDAARGRLYAVTSYNRNENLWVWKLNSDGSLQGAPQHFADGIPIGDKPRRGMLSALCLDAKRHQLYLGGALEQPKTGEGGIVLYALDAKGDPTGKPRFFPTLNKNSSVTALELSSDGRKLYESGWGDARVFAHRLDTVGAPLANATIWSVGSQGKAQLTCSPDGSALLMGTYPSLLEVVRLRPDGSAVGGLNATLTVEKQTEKMGVLVLGASSEWVNLDKALQNASGTALGRITLSGAPLTKAVLKIETALPDKPLRTFTTEIAGNVAAFSLPRYGEVPETLAAQVQSSAERYRHYLAMAQKYAIPPAERPRQFIVANGLIGLDSSEQALNAGLEALQLLGHNTVQIWGWPGIAPEQIHQDAKAHGFDRFRHAIYNPPSYFDFNVEKVQPKYLDDWAATFKKSATDMGATPQELALFHMADEPGWYYPSILQQVKENPERLAVFRKYLQAKGMTPELLGQASWDGVFPIGLSVAHTLPERRLLYWTARFYPESLSNAFAAATAALRRQLNPNLLTTTNLNNWPGRYFIASPGKKIGNNRDTGPDAAMGMPDWFDLGRKKAVSCIWTEDWFPDPRVQYWPVFADLLRCAAREGGIEFGAYVVGQTTGSMENGGLYKIMALAGHGAKAIDPYTFGPHPAFGDGWSEGEHTYQSLARGLRMLGRSERLIQPGRPRTGTVAILFPQASQVWSPAGGMSYELAELYGLHAALTHENYPVDFVDDYGVEDGELQKYKYSVLYVTAPNLSRQAQQAILEWTHAGGTLVLMPGAAAADEYNEPTDLLWSAAGAKRAAVPRANAPRPAELGDAAPTIITVNDTRLEVKTVTTLYQVAPLTPAGGAALATFADGQAALVAATLGQGRVLSFGYWPGVSYWNSPDRASFTQLPTGWSQPQRALITSAELFAKTPKHVDISVDEVEGALLESEKGVAVTLLNWSGQPQRKITVTIRNAGKVAKIESVEQGVLRSWPVPGGIEVELPLKDVDVLLLSR
jgi:hypothetical protein